ncbi:MAG: twin-arginine translocase subunit TatC [Alphaproteobacteria bacterium]|nr:twin-arginine translocase subunit TatC [Alphaproteobacteria bacterium]MBR6685440.1 twin-arginine translocase subunit TatC [Alphaproteobacteria bacterium]
MKKMTLLQHFSEMRRRVLWVVLIFLLAFVGGWYVAPAVQVLLTRPLLDVWADGVLLYSGVTDGLMIRFSLAALVAIVVVIPAALWHVWAFVAPGLRDTERRFIWPVLVASPVLFILGAAFAFYFLFPMTFKFFLELNQGLDVPNVLLPVARDYLTFAIGMLKVFGVAFQLPLLMVLLNRIGVLHKTQAIKMRRYAIVAIVVVAAVLTPPDIVSQVLLAIPMWLLFEISILFMRRD